MGSTPPPLTSTSTFNGTSQYAADLQQAINHAVTVASIPLDELENNVAALQTQSSEVSTLQKDFAALQTAIQNLSATGGGGTLTATVSDNTIASATVDPTLAISAGTYTLNIIDPGSSTTTLSNPDLPVVADPTTSSISTSSTFTLTVGTNTFTVTPATNTLNSLAQAINSSNAGVTATIVNIGSPTSPDYRLSLESTSLGDTSIQLNDGSQDLLGVLTTGTPAQYQVDGQPSTPISSNSSTVTLAPGVTADLLQAGQTTITVAPDSSSAANALSAFATAYNAALTELNGNHGNSGGALTGQSITFQLEQSLKDIGHYTGGSGSVQNLSDIGLTFNDQGQLTFNQATFQAAEASDPNAVSSFLGSTTTGGFLQNANNVLNGLEDINTGLFVSTTNSIQQQITSDNQEITDTETRITTMYNSMVAQMTQADTMIASLESQVSYFTTLFQDQQNVTANGG